MKSILMRVTMVIVALWIGCEAASAQKWLNKLQSGLDKATAATDKVMNKVDEVTESVADGSMLDDMAINADSLKTELLSTMTFDVKKVTETDDEGNILQNEDGTERVRYLLIDQDGKVCDATTAQKLISKRLKEYGKILGKTAGAAALGAASGFLSGGGTKGIIEGAAAGTVAGLAMSIDDMKNIRSLNKSIKNYKNTIAAYQKTFTDEGALIDAAVDLSNVDGINFSNVESTTMPSSQIEKELAESKVLGDSLDDIDISTI